MSSGWDSSGVSFVMSASNLTITEIMDMGFVARAQNSSSPCPAQLEQWDHRIRPKHGESPYLLKVSESTPLISGGAKPWLGGEENLPLLNRSSLNPDSTVFELSSLVSEPQTQFNNSIVEVFYGAKVSTPYKKEQNFETSDTMVADDPVSKLQDSELMVSAAGLQKSAPPMWELSEINSAVEESTPSLDVSISDLRFQSSSDREPPLPAQATATPTPHWVGATHKDIGRSYLQPFRYQRQLSASEIPIPSIVPPLRSLNLSAFSFDELGREWQIEVTAGPNSPAGTVAACGP
ncbi:uncharacterized protein LOC134610305 [Pelobates fuscus]|uniref:uncharacterized protein LOC134610305 n=1 Tax=Pelobates fuscus TaxID=191477 RepID=UPI002FE47BB0